MNVKNKYTWIFTEIRISWTKKQEQAPPCDTRFRVILDPVIVELECIHGPKAAKDPQLDMAIINKT